MHDFASLLGFALILALLTLSIRWHVRRSQSILAHWAADHRLHIVAREYRNFSRGPFFWTTSRGQSVYYVTVRNTQGHLRRGWVRCGGLFAGLWSNHAEVRWDE